MNYIVYVEWNKIKLPRNAIGMIFKLYLFKILYFDMNKWKDESEGL